MHFSVLISYKLRYDDCSGGSKPQTSGYSQWIHLSIPITCSLLKHDEDSSAVFLFAAMKNINCLLKAVCHMHPHTHLCIVYTSI